MNKLIIGFLLLLVLMGVGAFVAYYYYLPKLVAKAIIEEGNSSPLPELVQQKIDRYRTPINNSADKIIREMHSTGIPLATILREIDGVEASDIERAANEIAVSNPKTTNDVFNILKRNINTNLDIEPLRRSFNDNFNMEMVRRAVAAHKEMTLSDEANLQLFKKISREVLIKKEAEYQDQKQSKM